MGDVIPFPRIRSASEGLQAALRELDEAMAELMAACAERDRLLAERFWKPAADPHEVLAPHFDPYPPA